MHPGADPFGEPRTVALLVCALTVLAYLNSFAGVPQFDDWAAIVDEPRVASLAAWWESMPGIRPLLKLSYAANNSLGGIAGFHAVNLAIHLGNALLAWLTLRRLLGTAHARAAALAALLFALHPVNTEAVTLLAGRSVSLATLLMLASLAALSGGRRGLSLLLFVCAVGVRETALVLPALATLCQAWPGWRDRHDPAPRVLVAALRATAAHWLVALVCVALLLALPRYRELLAFSLATRAPLDNLVTQAGATLYLAGQLLQPFALNSDPRLPVFAAWDLRWAGACAFWILALGVSLLRVWRGSWAAFSVLWFALALAPTSSLIARLDIASERQLYLAAIPLYAALSLLWERALRATGAASGRSFGSSAGTPPASPTGVARTGLRRPANAIAALLIGTLLAATVLRNRDYHSETAFWSAVLAQDADNARAWNNLGYALERGQPPDAPRALEAYRRAAELDPADYKSRHNLRRLCSGALPPPACDAP